MAGIDPVMDPRGARWEARRHLPVLGAAWLAIIVAWNVASDLTATALIGFLAAAASAILLAARRRRRARCIRQT